MRIRIFSFFSFLFSLLFNPAYSQSQKNYPAGEIQLALKKLNTVGSVLYIAAHPDDENTRLLSYLANEKNLRTAYLSLTRGDGGQNLVGPEQAEQLGLIRTQELLAARRTDGAEQYFTRANDFGFSKNAEETFAIWDKEKILADVVWVIRNFKPDIIIARFPTNGDGGHGHHTASAILAEEAFDAAADPKRFPEQLKFVETWQAKRLLWNAFVRDPKTDVSGFLKLDVGAYNPLLGKSYGELAAESRSMHKSQGFGSAKTRSEQKEYFKWLKGDTVKTDIFENIDFTWNRIEGAENINKILQKAFSDFKPQRPELIIPLLISAHNEVSKIKDAHWRNQKIKELEELILACSGLYIEAAAGDYSGIPGADVKIKSFIVSRTKTEIKLERIVFPNNLDTLINLPLNLNQLYAFEKNTPVPKNTPYSNPYWLNQKPEKGIFNVSDATLIGKPENDASLNVTFVVSIGNKPFTIVRPLLYKWVDPVDGEKYRSFEVLPPVTVNIKEKVYMFTNTPTREVQVVLKSSFENTSGNLMFDIPTGWKVEPASIPFTLKKKGEELALKISVTAPVGINKEAILKAFIEINKERFSKSITHIQHKHIPIQVLLNDAEAKLVPLSIIKKGNKIGYIIGADDVIPANLKDIGYDVIILDDNALSNKSLDELDAIVVGIRAYNTNERMPFYYNKLMDYVNKGGNLIVQYNTSNFISSVKSQIGPYPFKISRGRVTVEEAPVTFDKPQHPLLNTPNKITQDDFEGWVQERGLYFAEEWDTNYETIISCNDPGEKPLQGSVIVAKHGKGYFIYTGLSFFRELPAGVPGAYRLFVNMISMGK